MAAEPDPAPTDGAVRQPLARCRLVALAGFFAQSLMIASVRADAVDVPAVMVEPSAASRSELQRVVRKALHGMPVTLADDALTASNLLSLEHARPRDSAGRLFNGRELSHPETFELFKRGSGCVLIQSKTGHSWTLRHALCAARPSPP